MRDNKRRWGDEVAVNRESGMNLTCGNDKSEREDDKVGVSREPCLVNHKNN